jgi:uncharacterized protein (UPF0297 family)
MAHHLKDLTIELDEKVGSVAAAAEALGKAGVNIEGICGFVVAGKGVGHVLVGDPARARRHCKARALASPPSRMLWCWTSRISLERWASSPGRSLPPAST